MKIWFVRKSRETRAREQIVSMRVYKNNTIWKLKTARHRWNARGSISFTLPKEKERNEKKIKSFLLGSTQYNLQARKKPRIKSLHMMQIKRNNNSQLSISALQQRGIDPWRLLPDHHHHHTSMCFRWIVIMCSLCIKVVWHRMKEREVRWSLQGGPLMIRLHLRRCQCANSWTKLTESKTERLFNRTLFLCRYICA